MTFGEGTDNSDNRYKYNGKELDRMHGLDLYDYGARMQNGMRFTTIDPLAEKYYSISPYAYCANNPIRFIDPTGNEIVFLIRDSSGKVVEQLVYNNGNFWHANGKRYDPGKESLSMTLYATLEAYRKIENSGDEVLKNQLSTLVGSKKTHYVEEGPEGESNYVTPNEGKTVAEEEKMYKNGEPIGTRTVFDFSEKSKKRFREENGVEKSNFTTVVHELRHQYDFDQGRMYDRNKQGAEDPSEIRAVKNENRARKIEHLPPRIMYDGEKIKF